MASVTNIYTTVKKVTNLSAFVAYLVTKSNININYYNYDPVVGTLTLTLNPASTVDPVTKATLDSLSSSYLDKGTLTNADVSAFRYYRAYKSSDQALTMTANYVNPVIISSNSYSDDPYYMQNTDGSFIYIKKPGVYLLMAKVCAYIPQSAATLLGIYPTTVLQWNFQNDDTRGGTLYVNISNSSSYTYHTNAFPMTDTTTVHCTFTVTQPTGTYLRLVCKPVSGAAPLSIMNDITSVILMSLSGASFYEGTTTTNLALTTTPSSIIYNTDRIVHYPFSHTIGSSSITIAASGTIFVIGKQTLSKTSGIDTSVAISTITKNGTVISGNGTTYSSPLITSGGKCTIYNEGTLDVVAGDVITMQAAIITGSALTVTSLDTCLTCIYLSPVNNKNNLYTGDLSIDNVETNALVTSTYTDVQFQSQKESYPNYSLGVILSTSTPDLLVNATGIYIVTADMSFYNPGGVNRFVGICIVTSVDTKTYNLIPGSTSIKQIWAVGKTTITTSALVYLSATHKIKLQVFSNGGTTLDNIQVSDSSNISIQCFAGTRSSSLSLITNSVFGNNFYWLKSSDTLAITTPTYATKCRLVTGYISDGLYRVGINAMFTSNTTTDSYTLQMSDVCTSVVNNYNRVMTTRTFDYSVKTLNYSDYFYLAEGIHNIFLQFASPNSSTLNVYNVSMELWQAS